MIVNDNLGRALREWILFAIGCAMIVGMTGKWVATGEAPDVTLGGIALPKDSIIPTLKAATKS